MIGLEAITAEGLIARLAMLKARRHNFDAQWQETKDLLWPDTTDFNRERSPGEKTNLEIFDMDPAMSLERGAAVLETFLTPRTQQWHKLTPSNKDLAKLPRVKEFFEDATDTLFRFRNAPRSRFYSQAHEGWKSLLQSGNSNLFVSELPSGGISYRYTPVACSWVDVDHEGVVDTIFYEYRLTAKAAVGRWKDKAPKVAHDAMASNPFSEHKYLHVVMPNDQWDGESKRADKSRFSAYEICVDSKEILERGGYHELPYMWSRYTVNPAEVYGRGPAMLVLPDIKTLQEIEKTFLRSGQKVADPPLLVADDGKLGRGNRRVKLGAGKMTVGGVDPQTGRPLILPLNSGARLDVTHEMQERRRMLIRSAFFLDIWEILAQDRVEMTATEFLGRMREKGQLLSPVVGRQQTELLGPMIEREIAIAQRQGKLPALPPELIEAQGEYEIEYESDATRMQKAAEVEAFPRVFESFAPFFENNPSLLEVFKQADAIRSSFETLGGSSRLLQSEDEYKQAQAGHQAAEQEAAEMAQVPIATKGVRDLAEAKRATQAAA